MKTIPLLSAISLAFFTLVSPLSAQVEFGLAPYFKEAGVFPSKSISGNVLRELFIKSQNGVNPNDFCIAENSPNDPTGFEADFDGDGSNEILLLWHNGPADGGCNTLFMIREGVNKTYELLDVFNVAPGKTLLSQIKVLPSGIQFYVQSDYTLPGGKREQKGAIFTFGKNSILVLISWVQNDETKDGKRTVTRARCGLTDTDFDHTKELYIKYTTFQPMGPGEPDEKSIADQYVLVLDYVNNHMRYIIYDSLGYDKVRKAEEMSRSGARLVTRETTAEQGVVNLREAIANDPFQTSARIALGRYFLRTGKPGDAEQTFIQAIEIDPLSADSYQALGDTYIKLNSLQQSLDNFRKYLELKPQAKDRKAVESKIRQITVPKRR